MSESQSESTIRRGPLRRFTACPRCRRGPLFESLLKARFTCTECGLAYDRGTGQHYGAMIVGNSLLGILWLTIFFALLLNDSEFETAILVPSAACVVVLPLVIRVALAATIHGTYYWHGDA